MALLFIILSSIPGAVANATAFGGANLAFSMLTDHDAKERKRHDLAKEKLQKAMDKWNENQKNDLILLTKNYVKRMRHRHTSTMSMKQCLNTIEYL